MLNLRQWTTIGALILGTLHQTALAGGEVSGGVDSYSIAPAYFRSNDGHRRITLCYEVSPQFGVPSAVLESTLRWAFGEWDAYLDAKDLHYAIGTGNPGIIGKLRKVKSGCQGNEDLRVYFGVENSDVVKYRPRLINPFAFSAITESSTGKEWNSGLLWVAGPGQVDAQSGIPKWNLQEDIPYGALKYVLLHEVGHVFGNSHVDWTIMTSRAGQFLREWTSPAGLFTGLTKNDLKIDQHQELVPNVNLAARFKLAQKASPGSLESDLLSRAFERIFGQASVGQVTAIAQRLENPSRKVHGRPDQAEDGVGSIELVFSDSQGARKALLKTTAKVAQRDDSAPLFNGQHGNHYRSFGASFSGVIEGASGRRIPVLVNFNMGLSRFTVVDLRQGSLERPLLVSELDE